MADPLTEEMRAFLQAARDSLGVDLTQELCTFLRSVQGAPADAKEGARDAGCAFFNRLKDALEPCEDDPPPSLTRS